MAPSRRLVGGRLGVAAKGLTAFAAVLFLCIRMDKKAQVLGAVVEDVDSGSSEPKSPYMGPNDLPLKLKNVQVKQKPDEVKNHIATKVLQSRMNKIRQLEDLGRYEDALACYENILEGSKKSWVRKEYRALMSDVCICAAGIHHRLGRLRLAIKYWELALTFFPMHTVGHVNLANVYMNVSFIKDPRYQDIPDLAASAWHTKKALKCVVGSERVRDRAKELDRRLEWIRVNGISKLIPTKSKIVHIDQRPYGIIAHPRSHRILKLSERARGAGLEVGDWIVMVNTLRLERGKLHRVLQQFNGSNWDLRVIARDYANNMMGGGYKPGKEHDRWTGEGLFPQEEALPEEILI